MKLSVFIITYNHEHFIRQAMDSVLEQDVDFDYEIVIGEDHSTDSTRAILQEYKARHPDKIRLLEREANLGAIVNFWSTLAECRGEYIALLEGDDYWTDPQKLRMQVEFLDAHPDHVICFHNVRGVVVDGSEPDFDYCPTDQKPSITFDDLLAENVIPTCSTVFRRGILGTPPDWLLKLRMGDYPLHLLNARFGQAGYLPRMMGVYRVHRGGTWRQMNWVTQVQANVAMFEHMAKYVEPRFRPGVRAALAKRYWQLTVAYEEMGDPGLARSYGFKSLRTKVWTTSPTLSHRIKRLSRLSAPALYRTAQKLFPRMRSSRARRGAESAARDPLVSVVIPAFNAERYLQQAVESVLAQSFKDFECIVVDDGSTDRTARILAELAQRDARVLPLRVEHCGIVGALNAGLKAARGRLVARMDADDLCLPQRFEKQVRYLDDHPDCVALGTRVMLVDPYGSPLWEIDIHTTHEEIDDALLQANGWAIFHPSVMMRRDPVLDVGGYRQEYQWSEDIDLFLRLAEVGRLANLPTTHLYYRQHLASVNRMKTQEQVRTNERLLAEVFRRRGIPLPQDLRVQPPPLLNRYDQYHAWGRRALINRNYRVARHHALAAVRERPFERASWSLMYHAAIGK